MLLICSSAVSISTRNTNFLFNKYRIAISSLLSEIALQVVETIVLPLMVEMVFGVMLLLQVAVTKEVVLLFIELLLMAALVKW